jgi:hypothetical protein
VIVCAPADQRVSEAYQLGRESLAVGKDLLLVPLVLLRLSLLQRRRKSCDSVVVRSALEPREHGEVNTGLQIVQYGFCALLALMADALNAQAGITKMERIFEVRAANIPYGRISWLLGGLSATYAWSSSQYPNGQTETESLQRPPSLKYAPYLHTHTHNRYKKEENPTPKCTFTHLTTDRRCTYRQFPSFGHSQSGAHKPRLQPQSVSACTVGNFPPSYHNQ